MVKTIKVEISDDEYTFIKWMAGRDMVSISEEMKMIFRTELRALQDLHEEESKDNPDAWK